MPRPPDVVGCSLLKTGCVALLSVRLAPTRTPARAGGGVLASMRRASLRRTLLLILVVGLVVRGVLGQRLLQDVREPCRHALQPRVERAHPGRLRTPSRHLRPRLSTHLSGKTIPSAALYLRAHRIGTALAHARQHGLRTPDDAAGGSARALAEGDEAFALRMILRARDGLRAAARASSEIRPVWDSRAKRNGWRALTTALPSGDNWRPHDGCRPARGDRHARLRARLSSNAGNLRHPLTQPFARKRAQRHTAHVVCR